MERKKCVDAIFQFSSALFCLNTQYKKGNFNGLCTYVVHFFHLPIAITHVFYLDVCDERQRIKMIEIKRETVVDK